MPISGEILKTKANELSLELAMDMFEWLVESAA